MLACCLESLGHRLLWESATPAGTMSAMPRRSSSRPVSFDAITVSPSCNPRRAASAVLSVTVSAPSFSAIFGSLVVAAVHQPHRGRREQPEQSTLRTRIGDRLRQARVTIRFCGFARDLDLAARRRELEIGELQHRLRPDVDRAFARQACEVLDPHLMAQRVECRPVVLEQLRLVVSHRRARRRKISWLGSASPIGSSAFTCADIERWKYDNTMSSNSRKLAAGSTIVGEIGGVGREGVDRDMEQPLVAQRAMQARLVGIGGGDVDVPGDQRLRLLRVAQGRDQVHVADLARLALAQMRRFQIVAVDPASCAAVEIEETGARLGRCCRSPPAAARRRGTRCRRSAGAAGPGRARAAMGPGHRAAPPLRSARPASR